MPHPMEAALRQQASRSKQSQLMQALNGNILGEVINFCPYGCPDDALDEHGYCRHLVGFTVPGKPKWMEPRVLTEIGRAKDLRYVVDGKHKVPTPKGKDVKLEEITVSSRVYTKAGIPDYHEPDRDDTPAIPDEQDEE